MPLSEPCLQRMASLIAQYKGRMTDEQINQYVTRKFNSMHPDDLAKATTRADEMLATGRFQADRTGLIMRGPLANQRAVIKVGTLKDGIYEGSINGKAVAIPEASVRFDAVPEIAYNLPQEGRGLLAQAVRGNYSANRQRAEDITEAKGPRYAAVETAHQDTTLKASEAFAKGQSELAGKYGVKGDVDYSPLTDVHRDAILEDVRQASNDGRLTTPEAQNLGNTLKELFDAGHSRESLDNYQIKLLRRLYGKGFSQAVSSKDALSISDKIKVGMGVVMTNKTAFDAGGFRQLATWLPLQAFKGLGEVITTGSSQGEWNKVIAVASNATKAARSDGDWNAYENVLSQSPNVQYWKSKGAKIRDGQVAVDTGVNDTSDDNSQDAVETLMQSKFFGMKNKDGVPLEVRDVPGVGNYGKVMMATSRYHEALLTEGRLSMMNDIDDNLTKVGLTRDLVVGGKPVGEELRGHVAHLVNMLSGSFTLRTKERPGMTDGMTEAVRKDLNDATSRSLEAMRGVMLAPRFRMARAMMADPVLSTGKMMALARTNPALADEYAKHIVAFSAMAGMVAGALKAGKAAGLDMDFGTDVRDALTFGKARVANVTMEFGGLAKWLRMAAQFEGGAPYLDSNNDMQSVESPTYGVKRWVGQAAVNKSLPPQLGYTAQNAKKKIPNLLWQETASGANSVGNLLMLTATGATDPISGVPLTPGATGSAIALSMLAPIIGQNIIEAATTGNKHGDRIMGQKGIGGAALNVLETAGEVGGVNIGDARAKRLNGQDNAEKKRP